MDSPRNPSMIRGHAYRVFGLAVRSDIALPELTSRANGEEAAFDVELRLGTFPRVENEKTDGFTVAGDVAVLNVPTVGRYRIRGGREILVEPDPDGIERNLRLYLLGSAIGAILHQRNILPLHANAIVFDEGAVAFMGASGAGKSTMAAWFHDRGHAVLADDVCAVSFIDGKPFAQPGIPRLRLWRDAVEASGRRVAGYDRSFEDAEKYNVPTRTDAPAQAIPLAALYVLDTPDPDRSHSAIQRRTGLDAAETLIANTYRGAYLEPLGGIEHHLRTCLGLAASVPVFSVERKWGWVHFDNQLMELENHARRVLSAL